jgi:hypothetical protein
MKHILSFNEKLLENKLYIENDFEEDIEWDQTIDISKLWNNFENKIIDLKTYNMQLATKLEENLNSNIEFNDIIKELKKSNNIDESFKIWDKLYNLCDEKLIELK